MMLSIFTCIYLPFFFDEVSVQIFSHFFTELFLLLSFESSLFMPGTFNSTFLT